MAIPSISELTVLMALWRQHPLSAREIHEQVEAELGWSYSSTRKTVERMLDKGSIRQHALHGVQVYEAALDKVDTLAAFAHDFGKRGLACGLVREGRTVEEPAFAVAAPDEALVLKAAEHRPDGRTAERLWQCLRHLRGGHLAALI